MEEVVGQAWMRRSPLPSTTNLLIMSSTRKEPLSVEAILQKQKDANQIKPKFLTKAERQAQALEKRAKEVEEQKQKEDQARTEREELERKSKEQARVNASSNSRPPRGGYDSRYQDPRRGSDWRNESRNGAAPPQSSSSIPTGPRADRVNGSASSSSTTNGYQDLDNPYSNPSTASGPRGGSSSSSQMLPPTSTSLNKPGVLTDGEQSLIKSRYLGQDVSQKRKKIKKIGGDKKFVFGWDASDDTSDKINPVYGSSVQAKAFGIGLDSEGNLIKAGSSSPRTNGNGNGGESDPLSIPRRSSKLKGAASAMLESHWSEKSLTEMKERDWRIFREDFGISARGGNIPRPLRSWKESSIPKPILQAIETIGYKDPSPIQRQAIPIGLTNRDLVGIAETGSGKTASFVIPLLSYILDLPKLDEHNQQLGPYALILAPTRELAQQIEGETKKFADVLGFKCVSIVGGKDMNDQAFNMRDGAEIVIATPGRLKDCIERHVIVLGQCTYVVMDEADRMVNLGFEEVVNFILDSLPVSNLKPDDASSEDPLKLLRRDGGEMEKYRVTMLYSATMPASVERMTRKYLRRPATITIGDANQAVGTVEQNVEFINSEEKKKTRLLQILNSGFEPPIIVFVNQKKMADSVGRDVQRAGWNTAILHSGKNQEEREYALQSLRSGECPILVATDLAGRGIDVPDVSLVINFQMSNHIEAYVHRIGRTGRAGKRGTAITFLENADEEMFYDLKQEISKSPVSKLSRELERHPSAQSRLPKDHYKRKRDDEE